jgi:hypothetical protein
MIRTLIAAAVLAACLPGAPSYALTKDAKMETCKFGADSKNLKGAERQKFINRCMSETDDPRGPGTANAPGQPKN